MPVSTACSHNTLSFVLLSDLHGIMVDIIKFISSSSDGAVHNAIQQAFGAEKQCYTDILVKVQSQLKNLLNATEIFLTLRFNAL